MRVVGTVRASVARVRRASVREFSCVPNARPRVVVALGGNAVLRDREAISGTNMEKNIKRACASIARIALRADVVLTFGNGPHVGYLSGQQGDTFGLDVVDAETQGMIGYELEQELRNVLPRSTNIAALLTQVEVDPEDPAFQTPTKPIGPFYDSDPSGTMAKIDGRFRRVVASPRPKRIVEIETIRSLISAGTLVICAGGGGIPVRQLPNGHLQGVPAVIDKDRTSCLLAECIGADALVMLTDIDAVYLDFKKPTQRKLAVHDATSASPAEEKEILEQLPVGSMRPKFEAALQFARTSGGAAFGAIGRMEDLPEILDGTAGTRVVASSKGRTHVLGSASPVLASLDKPVPSWTSADVESWLRHVVRIPDSDVTRVLSVARNGSELLATEFQHLHGDAGAGVAWGMASAVAREIKTLRIASRPMIRLDANPYPWPYNGHLNPNETALIIIDMQRDFLEKEGYIGSMGYDVSATRRTIEPIKRVLDRLRKLGFHIIHTREGHTPDLADCPQTKHWRSMNLSKLGIGDRGPLGRLLVKGEPGWDIIPELYPEGDEVIIDKPGKGAFFATSLDFILRTAGIKNLILTGVTTDVCVHTTLREANDRGYEGIILEDCTASLDESVYRAAIKSVQLSGGIFGATCHSSELLSKLSKD